MTPSRSDHAAWIRDAMGQYEHALVRYAARITGNLESARDVVQDTFLRLCRADRAGLDGRLAPWLFTVCRNRALDVRQKEGRMEPLKEGAAEGVASAAPGPDETADRHEAQRMLLEALEGLPDEQRQVFRLKFQRGLSYREICAETGHSLGAVSNLMTTAVKTLRNELAGRVDFAPVR